MIGFRGALRYTREPEVFGLELEAMRAGLGRRARQPPRDAAVRPDGARARALPRSSSPTAGCSRGRGFELWIMAEVPSVLFNLERYAALGVAGISIGSNDLTQLLLGADRDSELLAEMFDERDPAVADYLRELIPRARGLGPADLDLRPGAVGAPRVRGAAGPRGHRRHLGQHGRRRPHAAAGRRGGAAAAARGRAGRRLRVATTTRRTGARPSWGSSRTSRASTASTRSSTARRRCRRPPPSCGPRGRSRRSPSGGPPCPAAGAGPGSPYAGAPDLNDERAIEGSGILFLESGEAPAELGRIRQELEAAAAGAEQAGTWLADAMQAAWEVAAELLRFPELADLLGERHAIIAADWQSATTLQLLARQLRRAVAILDRVDFTAAGLRADLAGDRSTPAYVFSAAELLDQAADLTLRSATLVRGNERRWRVFHDRVAGLGPPA